MRKDCRGGVWNLCPNPKGLPVVIGEEAVDASLSRWRLEGVVWWESTFHLPCLRSRFLRLNIGFTFGQTDRQRAFFHDTTKTINTNCDRIEIRAGTATTSATLQRKKLRFVETDSEKNPLPSEAAGRQASEPISDEAIKRRYLTSQ